MSFPVPGRTLLSHPSAIWLRGVIALLSVGLCAYARGDEPAIDFARDIRPILSDACFHCHGNDEGSREADLRLDLFDAATAELPSGERAIVPGDTAISELVARIVTDDEDLKMPPEGSGKHLTPEQIELFQRWIQQGAKYEEHYAFTRIERPTVPQESTPHWGKTPIDSFVAMRHKQEGLLPTAEADRATLIRRVTLDLRGYGPTPEEVEAFIADESPTAYEDLVDRLLASPRFGEHKARYWLDVVRYADTHGMHLDNYREMWAYRDWVIESLNSNLPFDRFAIEQLAGDMLPSATSSQLIASGYNRCIVSTNEGGSIPEEIHIRNVVDRVNTTSTAFLGLTVGCAQCHDHKYDPLTQKEYYQLSAFFNNIDGNSMDGNMKDHAPYMHILSDQDKRQIAALRQKQATLLASIQSMNDSRSVVFEKWIASIDAGEQLWSDSDTSRERANSLVAHLPLDEAEGTDVTNVVSGECDGAAKGTNAWSDGRIGGGFAFAQDNYVELDDSIGDFKATEAFSYGCWVRTSGEVSGAVIARIDEKNKCRGWDLCVDRRRVAAHLIGSWPQYAIKITSQDEMLSPEVWHHVFLTYDGSARAKGMRLYVDGVEVEVDVQVDSINAKGKPTITNQMPVRFGGRSDSESVAGVSIDDVRLFQHELIASEVAGLTREPLVSAILGQPAERRSKTDMAVLREHFFAVCDRQAVELHTQIDRLEKELRDIVHRSPTTLVSRERIDEMPAYFLNRGDYEQRGEQVARKTPAVLPAMDDDLPRNRLGFAKWLVDRDHPLTARVTVNRIWQEYFGTGIVKTSENLGLQGDPPSHPELLDWLAAEFMDSGWDLKHLHRLIVTSATYRQSSSTTPESYRADPENRMLARGPRFRLDAEMLRDQALSVSGLLVDKLGGPSVKPYQPRGLWRAVAYPGSNTSKFKASKGDDLFRRSVYVFWKRTSPPPFFALCDAPSREESLTRREHRSSPLVALMLMNERMYFEAAMTFGRRAMQEGDTPAAQAEFLYYHATLTKPDAATLKSLTLAYDKFLLQYQNDPQAVAEIVKQAPEGLLGDAIPAEFAASTMLASSVMNIDPVICKE